PASLAPRELCESFHQFDLSEWVIWISSAWPTKIIQKFPRCEAAFAIFRYGDRTYPWRFISCGIWLRWRTREVFRARPPRCAWLSLRLVSRFESWKRKWA